MRKFSIAVFVVAAGVMVATGCRTQPNQPNFAAPQSPFSQGSASSSGGSGTTSFQQAAPAQSQPQFGNGSGFQQGSGGYQGSGGR